MAWQPGANALKNCKQPPMTIEIPLSQNKVALIDDADFDQVSKHKWCAVKGKKTFYAASRRRTASGGSTTILMHRILSEAVAGQIVDHRDCNGLNNQRSNLRVCSAAQNAHNKRKFQGISSYKGVTFSKRWKHWYARISINNRKVFLGSFTNEIDAARAYDEAAKKQHGEFARLNFG